MIEAQLLPRGSDLPGQTYRLLLLSDLHFGGHHFFSQSEDAGENDVAVAIQTALSQEGLADVDCLVLLGDLLYIPKDDVALAAAGVARLREVFSPKGLVSVPGNHDVTFEAPGRVKPMAYYDMLMKQLDLDDCESSELPRVVVLDTPKSVKSIALILLDSCRVEGEELGGVGYFGDDQFAGLLSQLDASKISSETHHIIALTHHHVLPVWPKEQLSADFVPRVGPRPKITFTVDGIELLRILVERKALMVCHGHDHLPAIIQYQNYFWGAHPVQIVVSGTAGLRDVDVGRHFFVVEISSKDVTFTSFATNANAPHMFELDPRRRQITVPLA
jgi:metallophosphoesterase superfamily enzyme